MPPEAHIEAPTEAHTAYKPHHAPAPYQPNSDPFHYLAKHFAKRGAGYHRSKLYGSSRRQHHTPSDGSQRNVLISAAGPIFSLLHRIDRASPVTAARLQASHWQHEMQAFIDQANQAGYTQRTIAAASFALSKLVDDRLTTQSHPTPHTRSLLPSHLAQAQKETIFADLLNACQEDTKAHLHLSELLFLCLSNQRPTPSNASHHGAIPVTQHDALIARQTLYTTLKQLRRTAKATTHATHHTLTPKQTRHRRHKQWFTICFISLGILLQWGLIQHHHTQLARAQLLEHQANQIMLSNL